jgi:hypothetical protein
LQSSTGDEVVAATGDAGFASAVVVKSAKKLNKSKHARSAMKKALALKKRERNGLAAVTEEGE